MGDDHSLHHDSPLCTTAKFAVDWQRWVNRVVAGRGDTSRYVRSTSSTEREINALP
jgi:hypothetical protein